VRSFRRKNEGAPSTRCRRPEATSGPATREGRYPFEPVRNRYSSAQSDEAIVTGDGRLVLRERIMLLQWLCVVAILVGMFFCTS